MNRHVSRSALWLTVLALGLAAPAAIAQKLWKVPGRVRWQDQGSPATVAHEEEAPPDDEGQTLHDAGVTADPPALVAFFHARSRTEVEPAHLEQLVQRLGEGGSKDHARARADLIGLGPLALQRLRRAANDLDHPQAAQRAALCLPWLEGPASQRLLIAAAHALERLKPDGAAAALLAYIGVADDADVRAAVNAALVAVAAPADRPDPALLRGLSDPLAARRAAAGAALCRAAPGRAAVEVRKLLEDPAPAVRLGAARALAEANEADAFPVLIALLADLNAEQRKPIEELLSRLAGEWTPVAHLTSEDPVARKVHRDAWAAWWKNTDGPSLLAIIDEHVLTPSRREKIAALITTLGDEDYSARETASKSLFELGRIALPQLRKAGKDADLEVARRAKLLVVRIEKAPSRAMPVAVIRLLAVRKPEGATAALLGYLPFAEEEQLSDDVGKALSVLALHKGEPDAALVKALTDEQPQVRATAAEALVQGAGKEGRLAARKLLEDREPPVRLRAALALVRAGEAREVPVLIDMLARLPDELAGQAEDALHQLAGDTAPEVSLGSTKEEKKKCCQAWTTWWKVNSQRVDLRQLNARPWYGYTLLCDSNTGRVYEIDRNGKERWGVTGIPFPVDACVVGNRHVLIAEYNGSRVTERDFDGKIIWSKEGLNGQAVNVQRLSNGNTFIAASGQLYEVDRAGKEVYTINNVGNIEAAYRARNGKIVCLVNGNNCLILDTTGKQLKSFNSGRGGGYTSGLDVLPNGHILITQPNQSKVVEFDAEGKQVVEVDVQMPTTATALPNGHFLVASVQSNRAFEVDRKGKIVWDHRGGGFFRARRR